MLLNSSFVLASAIIFVSYVLYTFYKKWYWAVNVPGTPLLQAVKAFLQGDISGDMKKVVELKQDFGKHMVDAYGRLYRLINNGLPVLVIADPTYCQELYQGSGVNAHPRGLGLGKFFERHMGDCMGCLNGKEWTR